MKTKFIFISLFIVSSTIIFPQLQTGSFLVGGGLTGKIEFFDFSTGSDYSNKDEVNIVELTFFPNAGYFVLENIACGISGRIGITDYELEHTDSEERTERSGNTTSFVFTYGIGPFFRYYYPIGDFTIIGELKYEWVSDNGETESFEYMTASYITKTEQEQTREILSPALGISYFFNRYISIESMLRYEIENRNYSNSLIEPNNPVDVFEMETNFKRILIVVGLQIYFPVE